jgi:uncharacterized protein (TIGR02246 family)
MAAKTPEDMTRVWTEAFNRGDLDALMDCYEPDCVLTRSSGPNVVGREGIRALFGAAFVNRPRMETSVRKIITNGELALCYGDWTLRGTNPDGTPRANSGKSVEVLRRQVDGTWRYILDDPFATGVSAR